MGFRLLIVALCTLTGCGLLGGLIPPQPVPDAGPVATVPYKQQADGRPCPGETPDSKCQPYTDCAVTKCDAEYKAALGADYKNGNFGGECKAFMECGKACGTTVCESSCSCMPDTACSDSIRNTLAPCILSTCVDELYACAGLPPPQRGSCDLLIACCNSLPSSEKTGCETSYNSVKISGDIGCANNLSAYKTAGKCLSVGPSDGGTSDGGLDGPVPTVCSTNGPAATVSFKNNLSTAIVTYWVNTACKEMKYTTIQPGGTASQGTFVGHVWRARDTSAKFIKDFGAVDAGGQVFQTP